MTNGRHRLILVGTCVANLVVLSGYHIEYWLSVS